MSVVDHRTARVLFTTTCFVLVIAGIYQARRVILIFILAILFTHLLEPVVQYLQRHSLFFRDLRGPAVIETYVGAVIVIGCMIFAFIPGAAKGPGAFLQSMAASLDDLGRGNVIERVGNQYGWTPARILQLKQFAANHGGQIHGLAENIEGAVPNILSGLALVPILAIFFLRDGKIITRAAIYLVSPWGNSGELQGIIDEVAVVLRTFMRTQVVLAALSLAFYLCILLLFRFPSAIALGLLGAILEFIPVAGWLIAATTILVVGVVSECHWIWVGILLLLWRCIQDYVNAPRIMGKHLQIHPLLSIFGIMVGYEVGGIVGVYLSVPVMAVAGVIWRKAILSRVPPLQTAAELPIRR